jgi:hypothetical protein
MQRRCEVTHPHASAELALFVQVANLKLVILAFMHIYLLIIPNQLLDSAKQF